MLQPLFRRYISIMLGISLGVTSAAIRAEAPSPSSSQSAHLTVQSIPTVQWFELEAIIEAVNQATISAQTSGRIKRIAFDVNDYVQQGQIVVQLVDTEQRAALRQTQAQVVQTQAQSKDAQLALQRAKKLHAQGSLSQGRLDSAKAQSKSTAAAVKAAKALFDRAQEQLSYTQIRAPYSGIVKARHVEVGEMVNPGKPVMTGLSLSKLRAVADVPQRFAPQLKKQQDFKVLADGEVFPAEKVVVFPYGDPRSHTFKVRVDINAEDKSIFPGMWVKLQIPTGEQKMMLIPESAVIRKGELSAVFVQRNGNYLLRQVRLGSKRDQKFEVLSGLREGETIATQGYDILAAQEAK